MKKLLACVALVAALSACASKISVIDERGEQVTMSEAIYAHKLSTEAYAKTTNESAACYERATTELGLAICGLSARSGQSAQMPQYVAPPTFMDRAAQFAPMLLGIAQVAAQDRANERQTNANVLIAGLNAQRELGIVQAATGSNERIAGAGFGAVGSTAAIGFTALADVAQSANESNTANSAAWASALGALPATTQIIAGRDVIQARDVDQSATGRDRVAGDGNEVNRQVSCVASGGPGGSSTGTNAGAASGTTSPTSTAYNALTSGNGAEAGNSCGN